MSKLLHYGRHLLYSTEVAAKIGRNEAICLQQIHYWMSISGGKMVDGIKWFWKTYQQWSEELQLSVSTVRRVINKLKQLGLIAIERLSAKTYYQANWYTLKIETFKALFQNEQIDAIVLNNSICSKSTDDIKDYPSEENSPQQHFADVEEKEEVNYKPPQITHCAVDAAAASRRVDIKIVDSFSSEDSNGDQFSGGEIEEENEVDTTLGKPNKSEIKEICTELKRLRINPDPCLGLIKKHWENVESAIARVKEAVNEGWCNNPTGLFINSCKSGEKPKNTINTDVKAWFEWARKERIVLAMSGGLAYTPDGKAVKISEIMQEYPIPN
ncbi:winged helix-turn-helix domain-containing protein [Calothrix sp. PCC 6303]|uniref:winged helix-turn-helix domain-containing protein n=1 Tax=Calothrix sp. PCC 6303 TaxID=1170562 RepID=UPI0002A05A30|nr:winged helix-turn-helix domain-containing protein [Calothrix sp. PCC 6303]AFZ01705.1 hypothetical protein Cal6303_2734 [Calothrix sp. PCC 6303]